MNEGKNMNIDEINKDKINKNLNEMMILYNSNKFEELARIRDDKNEDGGRRLAAHSVLQLGKDPRRLFWENESE